MIILIFFLLTSNVELRLEHMCEWEYHNQHDDEKDVFYAPMLAYVTDRGRLVSFSFLFFFRWVKDSYYLVKYKTFG